MLWSHIPKCWCWFTEQCNHGLSWTCKWRNWEVPGALKACLCLWRAHSNVEWTWTIWMHLLTSGVLCLELTCLGMSHRHQSTSQFLDIHEACYCWLSSWQVLWSPWREAVANYVDRLGQWDGKTSNNWTGVLDWLKRRKRAEPWLSHLSASWVQMQWDQLPHIPSCVPHGDGLDSRAAREDKPSLC